MFCTHCGNELSNNKLCNKCGEGAGTASVNTDGIITSRQHYLKLKKAILVITLIVVIPIALTFISYIISGEEVLRVFINWVLSLLLGIDLLGILLGLAMGIINFSKSSDAEGEEKIYFRKMGLVWLLLPVIFLIAIVFSYIVVSVTGNLINQ